jgi:hypothetical protein
MLTVLVSFLTVPPGIFLLLVLGAINAVSKQLPITVTSPFVMVILALAFSIGCLCASRNYSVYAVSYNSDITEEMV